MTNEEHQYVSFFSSWNPFYELLIEMENNEDHSLESDQGSSVDGSHAVENESESSEAIIALVSNLPCLDPEKMEPPEKEASVLMRRRSSVSIIQAITNSAHLLTTKDARRR